VPICAAKPVVWFLFWLRGFSNQSFDFNALKGKGTTDKAVVEKKTGGKGHYLSGQC